MGTQRYSLRAANPRPTYRLPGDWRSLVVISVFSYYQLVILFFNIAPLIMEFTLSSKVTNGNALQYCKEFQREYENQYRP
jgi:hypothetical protein